MDTLLVVICTLSLFQCVHFVMFLLSVKHLEELVSVESSTLDALQEMKLIMHSFTAGPNVVPNTIDLHIGVIKQLTDALEKDPAVRTKFKDAQEMLVNALDRESWKDSKN